MPALEPLRGLRVVADPAALDGARWHRPRRDRAPPRTRRRLRHRRRRPSTSTTSTRSSNRRPGSPASGCRSRSSRTTSSGRSRPSVPPSPRGSCRPSRPRSGCPTTARRCSSRPPPTRTSWRGDSDERLHGHAAGPPPVRAEVELRRRHRRRRRARPVDRVLPRDAPRDHQRGGRRGRLPRIRQHRSQHHDHPGQLRHPRGGPVLPAFARDVPGPRGRDGCRDPPPDQGHLLGRPHGDGDAHRARPGGR